MRHQYTRAELESITRETPVYLEGAGIAQLQWGGWEIAEGVRDGYLYPISTRCGWTAAHGRPWRPPRPPPRTILCPPEHRAFRRG